MIIRLNAFTARGKALAQRIAGAVGGEVNDGLPLAEWTAQAFNDAEALVFVGAAGIAVRAVAPQIKHKSTDPAVIVADEGGSFVIPILSGHLGGANRLAREIASAMGATAVITTATDVNGLFAVDEWAKAQDMKVLNPEGIVRVSGKILAGEEITISSDFSISGDAPQYVRCGEKGAVRVSVHPDKNALNLIPRIAALGIGCRKGTEAETIETEFQKLLEEENIAAEAFCKICSIDIKKDEAGLIAFCEKHGLPFETYSAEELASVQGDFSASGFVAQITGVDNVCERSAVLASGGELIVRKRAANGVTLAVALKPFEPDWSQT